MTRKKRRRSSPKINNLTEQIVKILKAEHHKTFNYKQICTKLGVHDPSSRNQVIKKLAQLQAKQQIIEVERGKYQLPPNRNYHTGILDISGKGGGYVIVTGMEQDIFVPPHNLNKALNGDEVEVYVYKQRRSKRSEGEVTRIIKRKSETFVGILEVQKKFAFVHTSESNKMYTDVFVPLKNIGKATHGDKVVVKLQDWPDKAESPFGKIIQVLGKSGEHQTEIHSILAQYGLPHEFPKKVEAFANKIDTSIKKDEIARRRDMRDVLTFTIDPKDAKDFDDALSFQKLENGNYEIGIHIADVSHYVVPGTVLDDEAYERATSIYLVDRVVPMLPEVLSNNACSLRPNEEKYTFSAVFELDPASAKIKNQWFGRTVTYSDARFAYEEAQAVIDSKSNTIPAEVSLTGKTYNTSPQLQEAILELNRLAKIMRNQRMKNGAISFDKVEVKFDLDQEANPVGVYFKTSKAANKLIEEFMLLANRKVSEFIGKRTPKHTFVYRVHDEPDDEKLGALQNVVGKFGYKLNFKDRKSTTASLNNLLKDVQGRKEQNLVDTLAIRSMAKAVYTTENIGHYGLAFDHYSHFTSPIRRYPDVIAHRLLQHYLDHGKSANEEAYEEKCKHSSNMEQLATNAERDSIKYMQIRFMQDHKDEEFLGVISGVTEWGIYVEIIANKCEGMVRLREIKSDHYEFDQDTYSIIGKNTKHTITLGDEVYVKVKEADLVKRHLDFYLVGTKEEVEN